MNNRKGERAGVQGMDPSKQLEIDNKMIDLDGTDNKVRCACIRELRGLTLSPSNSATE